MKRMLVRLTLAAACAAGLVACGGGPLIQTLSVSPAAIVPHENSSQAVTTISYSLSRAATVSLYLLDSTNGKHPLRENLARSAGDYEVLFGGAVNDRLLPDGQYQVVLAAEEGGRQALERRPLTITGADTRLPELQNFTVAPPTFTPNQDGIDDRVTLRYYLPKKAKVRVVLVNPSTQEERPIEEKKTTHVTDEEGWLEPGSHEYDYDGGIDQNAPPPPDGQYTVVAEAVDRVGNRVREERPLEIRQGGVPRATIIGAGAEFSPKIVQLGETLHFTVTVKNVGTVPIRTKGPEPGTNYTTSENYNTKGKCCFEEPGVWRVGVDFEGNSSGRLYPYRWQLGGAGQLQQAQYQGQTLYYLMPNQAVTITGAIRVEDKPPLVNPHYWIGLVQESVRIVEDRVGYTQITVEY